MAFPSDENVLVGLKRSDDAGVYRVSDDLALIQTVDFFTPVVDDPYLFGQIAAANALSDVYAMGGVPKTAMNLVAFPSEKLDLSILREILQGGLDKMAEAGVVLLGGHSIRDTEIKYGLSVTGFVHPDHVLVKNSPRLGDCLVLTKPLGSGVINTAAKAGLVPGDVYGETVEMMAALNHSAAGVMSDFDVSACTDITGFGLLGHLAEMVDGSGRGAKICSGQVPLARAALKLADMGFLPTAAYNNMEFRESMVRFSQSVQRCLKDLLFDPQTSGGLLIAVKADQAGALLDRLRERGVAQAACIGEITGGPDEKIHVE